MAKQKPASTILAQKGDRKKYFTSIVWNNLSADKNGLKNGWEQISGELPTPPEAKKVEKSIPLPEKVSIAENLPTPPEAIKVPEAPKVEKTAAKKGPKPKK